MAVLSLSLSSSLPIDDVRPIGLSISLRSLSLSPPLPSDPLITPREKEGLCPFVPMMYHHVQLRQLGRAPWLGDKNFSRGNDDRGGEAVVVDRLLIVRIGPRTRVRRFVRHTYMPSS